MVSVSVAPTLLSATVIAGDGERVNRRVRGRGHCRRLDRDGRRHGRIVVGHRDRARSGAGTGAAGVAQREGGGRAGAGRAGARREHQRVQFWVMVVGRSRQGVDAVVPPLRPLPANFPVRPTALSAMVSVSVAPTLLSAMVTPATANGSTAASAVVVTAAVVTVIVGATAASLSVTVTVLGLALVPARLGVAQREGGGRAGAGRAGARRELQRIQVRS